MYNREYQKEGSFKVNFEASGGLIHSSLVMQDKETNTYWAIMSGEAIAGELKGNKLVELPIGAKILWKDWVKQHPKTLVLSVNEKEDVPHNPYENYFSSSKGFRGTQASDTRMKTKEPIFAFHHEKKAYAVAYKSFIGGKVFKKGDLKLFLYRAKGAALFASTRAYQTKGTFTKSEKGIWIEEPSRSQFNVKTGKFEGGTTLPQPFQGFDTFWYNWSLSNPKTKILKE